MNVDAAPACARLRLSISIRSMMPREALCRLGGARVIDGRSSDPSSSKTAPHGYSAYRRLVAQHRRSRRVFRSARRHCVDRALQRLPEAVREGALAGRSRKATIAKAEISSRKMRHLSVTHGSEEPQSVLPADRCSRRPWRTTSAIDSTAAWDPSAAGGVVALPAWACGDRQGRQGRGRRHGRRHRANRSPSPVLDQLEAPRAQAASPSNTTR